jgi:hypothetical protein
MELRAAVLVLAAVLVCNGSERVGAEPHAPMIGLGGTDHEHRADWNGAWIARNFQRCCGEEDCAQVPLGGVAQNPDGSYTVLETGEIFAFNDPEIEPSEDGSYWRCRYQSGQLEGQTRCLFVPPVGF